MTAPKPVELPDIIHVGYQDVQIREVELIEAFGAYLGETSEIRIDPQTEGRQLLNTVIHEVLHACAYAYGLKSAFKDDEHEERIVETLGNALTDVFVRNPKLVAWLKAQV